MTLRPDHEPVRPPQGSPCDETPPPHAEQHDERSPRISATVAGLVTSWPRTLRTLVLVVAVLAAVTTALLVLPVDITIGPVTITQHD